jgi:quercetin dioxygenase-like cupin family protein
MTDTYFSSDFTGTGELQIVRAGELKELTVAEGVHLHPLLGERLNINVVVLDAGAVAEVHTHPEEQMGYVVSGECEFSDGATTWRLVPGDTYRAAPGVPHGARAFEERCVIIDVFSPPRAGLREMLES